MADDIRSDSMYLKQRVAIANAILMVAVCAAWLAGFHGTAFIAVGTATFGFAFLWPQYESERGVWMGGLLILLFAAFGIFIGLANLFWIGTPDDVSRTTSATIAIVAGIAILTIFFAFSVYATVVNYRLSRKLPASPSGIPGSQTGE